MANNYTKTMRQALQEARNYRDPTSEGGPGSGPQKDGASKPDDKSSPKARPKIDKVALQKDLEDKVTDGMIDIDHGKDGSMDMSKEYEGGQDYEVDRDVNAIKKDLMSKGISEKDIEIDIEEDEEYINLNVSVKGKPVSEGIDEGGPGSGPQKGGKKQSSANIKKAYGILNDPRYKQGNYSGAAKAIDKLSPGLSNHPDVKNAMKRANEELEEENRFSRQLKGRQREVYDLALKDIRKNKVYGEKDQDAVVDKVAGTSLMGNSLSDVKRAIQHESLDLSATGDTTTSNASQENETVELDEAKLSTAQLDTLKQKYSGLRGSEKNGIQMDKLAKIMKRYPKSMLDQLAGLDIPMVSKVAKAMTEETMTEAWQYEMDIEYGDYDDRLIVFGNIRGANLETQADRAYDKLEKEMEKKFGRDIAIEGGVFKGKTNTRSRGVSATGKVDPRESDPIQRKDI